MKAPWKKEVERDACEQAVGSYLHRHSFMTVWWSELSFETRRGQR
jgi:hypothetical protein